MAETFMQGIRITDLDHDFCLVLPEGSRPSPYLGQSGLLFVCQHLLTKGRVFCQAKH